MKEGFNQPPPRKKIEAPESGQENKEGFKELSALFDEAEKVFESEGRESAKKYTPALYKNLQNINGSDMSDWTKIWNWNPNGGLSEEEFNELNLRRKKLSNAIGIMAKAEDGTVYIRHDLNKI